MSHLQFCRAKKLTRQNCARKLQVWHRSKRPDVTPAILSREFFCATKLQVWHGESREFLTVAQLYLRIELCSILCNFVTECWMLIDATLSHDFVAHSRDKIARENCRCDIGLTTVLSLTIICLIDLGCINRVHLAKVLPTWGHHKSYWFLDRYY